jgi:hypothetical protein
MRIYLDASFLADAGFGQARKFMGLVQSLDISRALLHGKLKRVQLELGPQVTDLDIEVSRQHF